MRRDVAERVVKECLQTNNRLNVLLREVEADCSSDEFKKLKRGVGSVLGSLLIDLLNPVLKEYPDLRPTGLEAPH